MKIVYISNSIIPSRTANSCGVLLAPYQKEVAVGGGSGNTVDFMSPLKVFEYMSNKKSASFTRSIE